MQYWLLKTEPEEYGYHDLEAAGTDIWDGVKNFAAQSNIKKMNPGDLAFIYHTGKEKAIVGVAEIASNPYPDPNNKLRVFDVKPQYRLNNPVYLAQVKQDPIFQDWELVRLPRLSVMPVSPDNWQRIHAMSNTLDAENNYSENNY